jgi:hypothetical protein
MRALVLASLLVGLATLAGCSLASQADKDKSDTATLCVAVGPGILYCDTVDKIEKKMLDKEQDRPGPKKEGA